MRQSRFSTTAAIAFGIAVFGLTASGCAGGYLVQGSAGPTAEPSAQLATVDEFALATTAAAELGEIITDGAGMTLYRFDADTARPPTSTCDGDCALAWPPAIVTDPAGVQVSGVAPELVGTVERADGSAQLTIAGWPAYYFSDDDAPGDRNGQGVGGTWFAFTPAGRKAAGAVAGAGQPAAEPIAVMDIAGLGKVLTDREGMTLYRFDRDSANPSRSVCVDECASTWPPVTVPEGTQVTVTGAGPVGTVVRPDGLTQVTVGGWPLYRFSGDAVPCDINGHGVGGTWFAASPSGGKAG